MMSKSPFTLLLLFLADSINMSVIEKLLVCEQMLALLHTGLLACCLVVCCWLVALVVYYLAFRLMQHVCCLLPVAWSVTVSVALWLLRYQTMTFNDDRDFIIFIFSH
jgi:hypothetical protein